MSPEVCQKGPEASFTFLPCSSKKHRVVMQREISVRYGECVFGCIGAQSSVQLMVLVLIMPLPTGWKSR